MFLLGTGRTMSSYSRRLLVPRPCLVFGVCRFEAARKDTVVIDIHLEGDCVLSPRYEGSIPNISDDSMVSPVNISGTISHLTSLFGTNGSTGPHGGESKSAPFCILIVQCVPLEERNPVRAPPAIPFKPDGVPSHRIGYDLPKLASKKVVPALTREGAWNSALHAPKEEPVNCVASQK